MATTIYSVIQGKKTTELPLLSELLGDEQIHIVDVDGVSRRTPLTNILTLIEQTGSGALLAAQNLADLPNKAFARQNLGLGTISTQNANAVTIVGGSINNTPVGNITPSTGRFTNLTVLTAVTLPPGSINITAIGGLIPNEKLEHSQFAVSLTDGLVGSATVELGGTLELGIEEIDGGLF